MLWFEADGLLLWPDEVNTVKRKCLYVTLRSIKLDILESNIRTYVVRNFHGMDEFQRKCSLGGTLAVFVEQTNL